MKNRKISMISTVIIILIVIIFVIVICIKINKKSDFKQVEDKTTNNIVTFNNRAGITRKKEINGLSLRNIKLTIDCEVCVFEADVKNLTDNMMPQCEKLVIFKDNNGNEVGRVGIYLDELQPNQESHFYSETSSDFKDAYTFEIVDLEKK